MIPILILGLAAAGTLTGTAKGVEGVWNIRDAQARMENGKERHARALLSLEHRCSTLNRVASAWGERQVGIASTTLASYVKLVRRIGNKGDVGALELLKIVDITPATLETHESTIEDALRIGGALASAVVTGGAACAGTTTLVGLFGTASTGAAISGLSGAAAESATLAYLGGGALSVGGGGMALGSIVLGGVALAPAAMIAGFALASQGERAQTRATAFKALTPRPSTGRPHRPYRRQRPWPAGLDDASPFNQHHGTPPDFPDESRQRLRTLQ